ncbi:hypothetical protein ACFWOL_28720 [Streptomyces sp. NPDC058442]|uniref:hypothetical protein n=1 Tax=Streptomyces sp. NPDC058442 TaxID=3346503 RepID=UPI003653D872
MTASAYEFGTDHRAFVDPYALDGSGFGDYQLTPPRSGERLDVAIDPQDRRRLELHAALTAAGIPPRPEDREAIDRLSALPGNINNTIQRWLAHTL